MIYDTNGIILAGNITTTSLVLIPNQIKNKEDIMNSDLPKKNKKLSKKEAELLSYCLGYGKLREEILNNNSREKHKIKESSKGYK